MRRERLPIDSFLPDLAKLLRESSNLIIEAEPGAGKTTRVPPWLLEEGLAGDREVLVLEPRRLAARLAARRVAEERGEPVGRTIGFTVRHDDATSRETRLRFVTEGVLTRRLLADRHLDGVGVVVLDEFHERHLQSDVAIALLRRLQTAGRPDLKIVVMSATLDVSRVSRFLGDAPCLRVPGRLHEVMIEHLPRPDSRPLVEQVEAAVGRVLSSGVDGDILVFLPGAAEIRRAMTACQAVASTAKFMVLPLHGALSPAEQDRAVGRTDRRKIILSTNVTESSVTIDGVIAVIDSGLARVAGHSPWSGLPHLAVARIARASAIQRAGRAGRTRPGRCLRLYTNEDYNARPEFEAPEVGRQDLAESILELASLGITEPASFNWFESPPESSIRAAQVLLRRLGALDSRGHISGMGERMLDFPTHPRLSRLIVESEVRGVGDEGALAAALIGEEDILASDLFEGPRGNAQATRMGPSDVLDRLDRFAEIRRAAFNAQKAAQMQLDPIAVQRVESLRRQLVAIVQRSPGDRVLTESETEDALLISILSAYPDRVARRQVAVGGSGGGRQGTDAATGLLLSGGGLGRLSRSSVVQRAEFIVAVAAEERASGAGDVGRGKGIAIRLASAIKVEWLLDLFIDAIRESDEAVWNQRLERVDLVRRLSYDDLVIDEQVITHGAEERVVEMLSRVALETGIESFVSEEELGQLFGRVEFFSQSAGGLRLARVGEADVRAALVELCRGKRSLAEVKKAAERGGVIEKLRHLIFEGMSAAERRDFAATAPEQIRLAHGRQVKVQYGVGKVPWIAARVQDFFGMREGPRLGSSRVALVLHLLAPNNRPVQVTSDLEGFWERQYPQVRRELGRRYPRHRWPEDPLSGK